MTPYYSTPCGSIRIFHARWEDVLAAGGFKPKDVALVHADPPYGKREQTDRSGRVSATSAEKHCKTRVWPAVAGDSAPFDPSELLSMGRPSVVWGANYFPALLPASSSWIFWDKRYGSTPDLNADGELAWSNLGGPLRTFRHLWRAICRASEAGDAPLHPTQKPEALSAWVFQRAKLKRGDLLLVPYMGSGPDLRPALAMGLRVIACEVEELYCRTAVNARLRAVAREEPAAALGPLFGATP